MRNAIMALCIILFVGGGVFFLYHRSQPQGGGQSHTARGAEALRVLCAPALRKPAEVLFAAFTRLTGTKVEVSYNGSNVLLGQLKLQVPGDVFMPADNSYTDEALKQRLVENPKSLCYLIPVMMTHKGNPFHIQTLEDLRRPEAQIGLGDARAAAIGKVTEELLVKNHLSANQLHVVYYADMVDELGNAIKLGTIDAAVVWNTTALNYPNTSETVMIPLDKNIVVLESLSVVAASSNKPLATQFINFATSPAGKAILQKFAYRTDLPSK